ncbi:MAG: DUF2911 domain-containing protein [Bacteroidota bacterium]
MKYLLFACFALFMVGCNSSAAPGTDNDDTVEAPVEGEIATYDEDASDPDDIDSPEGDNFMTEILEKDIPSPRKQMTSTMGDTKVTVNYGSPSVKGRTIWGDLEPYDEVWRTGANDATTIEFSEDVMIEGEKLAAGKYALFTIPSEGEWTVIFNSKPDQFGDYSYDEADDALRVKVTPMELDESVEQMAFEVEDDKIILKWDRMAVPFAVTSA